MIDMSYNTKISNIFHKSAKISVNNEVTGTYLKEVISKLLIPEIDNNSISFVFLSYDVNKNE